MTTTTPTISDANVEPTDHNPWLYWDSARSPFASAVFVLPLLVLYELCVFGLPPGQINNGAHQWANKLLMLVGLDDVVLPLLMFLILFVWQYYSKKTLVFHYKTLMGMWAESILFAMLLIGLGQAQQLAMIGRTQHNVDRVGNSWEPIFLQIEQNPSSSALINPLQENLPETSPKSMQLHGSNYSEAHIQLEQARQDIEIIENALHSNPQGHRAGNVHGNRSIISELEHPRERFISYLGAGIYEETFFRLLMIPVLYLSIRFLIQFRYIAMLLALLISSLFFALAHEVIPAANHPVSEIPEYIFSTIRNDPYRQFVFAFRGLAGLYFGVLFYFRGFGIAVGSHLVYDIFVGIMLK